MASEADIATVRLNTAEAGQAPYSDEVIDQLVDTLGIDGASAQVWDWKAAAVAKLVNNSEAGASHSFSDLHKAYLLEASKYHKRVADAEEAALAAVPSGIRIHRIERA